MDQLDRFTDEASIQIWSSEISDEDVSRFATAIESLRHQISAKKFLVSKRDMIGRDRLSESDLQRTSAFLRHVLREDNDAGEADKHKLASIRKLDSPSLSAVAVLFSVRDFRNCSRELIDVLCEKAPAAVEPVSRYWFNDPRFRDACLTVAVGSKFCDEYRKDFGSYCKRLDESGSTLLPYEKRPAKRRKVKGKLDAHGSVDATALRAVPVCLSEPSSVPISQANRPGLRPMQVQIDIMQRVASFKHPVRDGPEPETILYVLGLRYDNTDRGLGKNRLAFSSFIHLIEILGGTKEWLENLHQHGIPPIVLEEIEDAELPASWWNYFLILVKDKSPLAECVFEEVHAYVRGRKEEGEGAASETTASRTTAIVAFGDQPLSGTKEGAPINYFIGWKKRRPDSPEVGPEQASTKEKSKREPANYGDVFVLSLEDAQYALSSSEKVTDIFLTNPFAADDLGRRPSFLTAWITEDLGESLSIRAQQLKY